MRREYSDVRKVSVHATCTELFKSGSDMLNLLVAENAITHKQYMDQINELVNVLLSPTQDALLLNKLFRDGYVPYMLAEFMDEIDECNTLREVYVTGNDGKLYRIDHKNICF